MKRTILILIALFATCCLASAQDRVKSSSAWSLTASPVYTIPLVGGDFSTKPLFSEAWGGALAAEYGLGRALPLAIRLGLGYSTGGLEPSEGIEVSGSLREASFLLGLSARVGLARDLSLRAFLDGGAAYGNLASKDSLYAVARAGGGLSFGLGQSLAAGFEAAWLQKLGLYGGLSLGLGLSYRLPAAQTAATPPALRLLDISSIEAGKVFPIFRSYYDEHPVGSATITNTGKRAATGVHVTFFIKQYMDAPKECALIPAIEPGRSVELPLYALFNDDILDVTEATKAIAEVGIEYAEGGSQKRDATVLVYDRNALTWDDDRHAAAFVSSKDPWVLDLAGNFTAAIRESRNAEVAKNLQTAVAFHEGLRAYGIGYVPSPSRPFAKEGGDLAAVDTLKFPRQTLGYRAGDCADLSVLYASCLESAGVETALVTVPGHIFVAFDLGLKPGELAARGLDEAQLIVAGDRAWVPIETTMRDSGFLDAWRKAAAQWRDASAKKLAALYPIHEAWLTYAPVGLPADGTSVTPPPRDAVRTAFRTELGRIVAQELQARVSRLGAVPATGPQSARALNDRGVLYGKYGMLAESERDFKAAAAQQYLPAIVNLGNVAWLKSDSASAYSNYKRAANLEPDNARLQVLLSRSASALGKSEEAATALAAATRLDPLVAERYSSTPRADTGGTRAAQAESDAADWF